MADRGIVDSESSHGYDLLVLSDGSVQVLPSGTKYPTEDFPNLRSARAFVRAHPRRGTLGVRRHARRRR